MTRETAARGPGRLRVLLTLVLGVSIAAIGAVVALQAQEHQARANETLARSYSASLDQSIADLLPVGLALSQNSPELLAQLIRGAVQRSVSQLETIREVDPSRTSELETLISRVRGDGLARNPAEHQRALVEITRASTIAEEIADDQHARAERAELTALVGSGAALAFAVLAVLILVLRDRRRSLADAAARTAVVRRLAEHDSLTDLPNRRRFDADLAALRVAAGPVEIAVCDLNEFKAINDRLGHDAGDALLITVGRDLQAAVGDAGTVYRTGGDEFSLISGPGLSVAEPARQVLERDGSTTDGSVGAAMFPSEHAVAREVVRLADRRMYAAKLAVAGGGARGPELRGERVAELR